MSYVKRSQLPASPVKLIFCGLPPFYKTGAKIAILTGQILLIQGKGTCRKSSVLQRAYFKMYLSRHEFIIIPDRSISPMRAVEAVADPEMLRKIKLNI
jgi:hypothetical protein